MKNDYRILDATSGSMSVFFRVKWVATTAAVMRAAFSLQVGSNAMLGKH